jgi:uncharacterized protein YprB with RNaseH-like and TPR domain/predicted RNA-binding Zn-ribbon protein involved in translation (DUF1610 family)
LKIAHLDLECSNLNADWGIIICACIKWDGGKIDTFRLTDYKQKDIMDDSGVCAAMRDALNTADMWTGWYSARFDIPYLQARLLYHGEDPISSKVPHVDLWRTAKYQLKLSSNRLANIQRFFKLSASKTPIDQGTWIRAIAGNKRCMKDVVDHCKEDVKMLEEAYHKLLPLIKGHPNIGLFEQNPEGVIACPKCGSSRMQRNGHLVTQTRRYQRWRCLECGSSASSRLSEKVELPPLKP